MYIIGKIIIHKLCTYHIHDMYTIGRQNNMTKRLEIFGGLCPLDPLTEANVSKRIPNNRTYETA